YLENAEGYATKVRGLEKIKHEVEKIDKEIKLEILEKYLPSIINMYVLTHKADPDVQEVTVENPSKRPVKTVKTIISVVKKAIEKFGVPLTEELKRMKVVTARQILREVYLEKSENTKSTAPQVDKKFKEWHDRKFKAITDNLSQGRFYRNSIGRVRVIDASGHEHDIESFRSNMKIMITHGYKENEIEEVIENGIKEIENQNTSSSNSTANNVSDNNGKVSETSDNEAGSDTSDDYSEVSSIFDEYEAEDEVKGEAENTDNSSDNTSDNNDKPKYDNLKEGHEDPKFIESSRESNIKYVMDLLNKEPVVKEEDLEVEN
ncbi:16924_t:CDS:2, partial [Funneliformis geosporum]